jgi:succinate dehydrogenase flavin-adding protein (antitoxin of CptAB toxin-antitoxin module)
MRPRSLTCLTAPAPQIQNSLAYRAKQRGFLELDLLVVRARRRTRRCFRN